MKFPLKKLLLATFLFAAPANANANDNANSNQLLNPAPIAEWSGAYFGISLGRAETELSSNGGNGQSEDFVFGAHLGQSLQIANFVFAIEMEYRQDNTTISGSRFGATANVNANFALNGKLKAGLASGKHLVSAIGGLSYLSADASATFAGQTYSTIGGDVGQMLGVSYDYMITNNLSIGAEYNYSEFDNFDDANLSFDIHSVNARATLRF